MEGSKFLASVSSIENLLEDERRVSRVSSVLSGGFGVVFRRLAHRGTALGWLPAAVSP